MEKPVLIVMAAGLGSRFGGLKQMAPVDPQGHMLMDYSVYDARRAGFERVIFIVSPEHKEDLHSLVGRRISRHMEVCYAFQRIDDLPEGFSLPAGRTRPWGTAHAVLAAKDMVSGPFAVINADDYYGEHAYRLIYGFLSAQRDEICHAMVGYRIENTLTENGPVARGICRTDEEGFLTSIIERTHVEPRADGAAFTENGVDFTPIAAGTAVSMNMWGFSLSMMGEIEAGFAPFLRENLPKDPMRCEYFLPLVPNALVAQGSARVRLLSTPDRWYGMTYAADMPVVREALAGMKRSGEYPEELWGESDAVGRV